MSMHNPNDQIVLLCDLGWETDTNWQVQAQFRYGYPRFSNTSWICRSRRKWVAPICTFNEITIWHYTFFLRLACWQCLLNVHQCIWSLRLCVDNYASSQTDLSRLVPNYNNGFQPHKIQCICFFFFSHLHVIRLSIQLAILYFVFFWSFCVWIINLLVIRICISI